VRAYENAARTFEGVADEPAELLERGTLAELPGVGPGMVASVAEIVQTGHLQLHDELRAKYPVGLLELFRVGGLGGKKVRTLYQALGIASPADLERACREGRVAALPGFGAKSEAKILETLATLGRFRERHRLDEAHLVAERVGRHLASIDALEAPAVVGSLRRARETIGDLDFLAVVAREGRDEAFDAFAAMSGVQEVESRGPEAIRVRLERRVAVDLRTATREEYPAALQRFTGNQEHNELVTARARDLGMTLDERGLFRDGVRVELADETALYRALGLAWIPPELREGRDEVELAARGELPTLVEPRDLRGTLHVHTSWSDGTASLAEMAEAAAARGWEYLGIADHSKVAAYAGGLSPERVLEQWREIDAWNAAGRRPHLFKGTECDILADGALDFADDLLVGFDFVVVSVHSRFQLGREAMTARLVRAVSHPAVTFLGHATGRLLLAREGYDVDLEAVLDAAEKHGVIVELNASPHRLDLDWRPLTGWLRRGCRTSIHPDAHSPQGLGDVDFGISQARKAGARREDVFNTGELAAVGEYLERRRQRARDLLSAGAS
jgi:DNA polymerase (family 10)